MLFGNDGAALFRLRSTGFPLLRIGLGNGGNNRIKSIGHGITTIQDLENTAETWNVILALTQAVGYKLRKHHKFAGGVAIHVRNNQLQWKQWQRKLPLATNSTSTIANALYGLFAENYKWEYPIRSLSVHAINMIGFPAK